jgi:hypothetical protein
MYGTFLTTFLLAPLAAQAHMSFGPCGGIINTTHIEILPTHVVPGEDLTVLLTVANGHEPITDGILYYHVYANGLDEQPQVDHLCDVIKCPIPMGTVKIRIPLFVPEFKGDARIRVELAKRDLSPLVCIKMEVQQSSWLRAIFGGIKMPLLEAPPPIFALPDSYALSKE